MKNDQPKMINSTLIGKDELNLIECPFACLTPTPEQRPDKLAFIDKQDKITRHWKILGSREYGLPCSLDESVYIAMLCLTKRHGLVSKKIPFSQYEILKLMGWQVNGERYNRLGLALKRLSSVTIETNYLWDRGGFRKGTFLFHIIEEAFLDRSRKNSQCSYFVWSETVSESLLHGNIKNLDLETYFSLTTAISKRFFRLIDKRLHKSGRASFDLKELCHEKLGLSRNIIYPSELKRKLGPTLKEHRTKGLLSSATYTKTRVGNWLLTVRKCNGNPEPIKTPSTNPSVLSVPAESPKDDPLIKRLISLGIPNKKALVLLREYPYQKINAWVEALPMIKPGNPGGYLFAALSEDWALHPEAQKRLNKRKNEQESELKGKYNQYVFAQVDERLKNLNPIQLESEIEEFKRIFMEHWGLDTISPVWLPKLQNDFKWRKAKTLNIPTFEEWRKQEKVENNFPLG